jgi:hypothetical protein
MIRMCNVFSWHRAVWPAMILTAACAVVVHAQSGTPAPASTIPATQLQYATVTGSGNSIIASRVPVLNSKGQVIYQDITIQFDVDQDGNVTLTSGYPTMALSPNVQTAAFQPGKYIGPSSILKGNSVVTVSGPGVSPSGATQWSLTTPPGSDSCTRPTSATWYTGGSTEGSPFAARLKYAGITSTAWSYGIIGTASTGCSSSSHWDAGVLIGASQIGNTLTLVSFSNCGGCSDSSTPVDQITYTLMP